MITTRATTVHEMYDATREAWGGMTVELAGPTGYQMVLADSEAYAVTTKPAGVRTVHVALDRGVMDFYFALMQATERFAGMGTHIGIFHNVNTDSIHIDPVTVVATKAEVDTLPAAQHPDFDGAYEFHTGNGYYPNGR